MPQNTTVHVSDISSGISDKEVQDFFSFCGKITTISVTPVSSEPNAPKSASVTFEKEAAAKTALLLDNTQLGPSTVHVTLAHTLDDIAGEKVNSDDTEAQKSDQIDHHIPQEDKPRSRIVAEYIAHGYVLSDQALQKAIALDQKHGVSSRFTSILNNFDSKYNASDRVRGLNENYKLSDKAASGWKGLNSYFEKALETPSGRKLREFYVKTDKQVRDIHEEARRLADLKSGKVDPSSPAPPVAAEAAGSEAAVGGAPGAGPTGTAPPSVTPAPKAVDTPKAADAGAGAGGSTGESAASAPAPTESKS